jgi:hypothetical protein
MLQICDHAPARNSLSPSDHWKQVALEAWQAQSWREAAIEYHKSRSPSLPTSSAHRPSEADREVWQAAGRYVSRKSPHDALRTFLKWCDRRGVSRAEALPIFEIIVDKELAK